MRTPALVATTALGACSLGLVDVPLPDPEPARFMVVTELSEHPTDPDRVRLSVRAVLEPGVTDRGQLREMSDDRIRIGDVTRRSSYSDLSGRRPVWTYAESFPRPGPETIVIGPPGVAGLRTADDVEVQVGVHMSPEAPVVQDPDGELSLSFDPAEAALPDPGPFSKDRLDWRLDVRSPTTTGGWTRRASRWIEELRVAARELPASDQPLHGELRILLLRLPASTAGTLPDAYHVEVESTIERSFEIVIGDG